MINIVSLVSNFVSGGFASLQLKDLQKRYMRIVIGVARPDMIFLFYHLCILFMLLNLRSDNYYMYLMQHFIFVYLCEVDTLIN